MDSPVVGELLTKVFKDSRTSAGRSFHLGSWRSDINAIDFAKVKNFFRVETCFSYSLYCEIALPASSD